MKAVRRETVAKDEPVALMAEPPAFTRPKVILVREVIPPQEGDLIVTQRGDLEGASKWREELFCHRLLDYLH